MEEIEVFCTKSLTTGENVKLFLEEEVLAPGECGAGQPYYQTNIDAIDVEDLNHNQSSGQEVQRISVINNLPDLLRDTESHDECMRRVVPKVREVLHVAQTEMQLAASSAFLQILQKNLVPIQNYSQTFLQTILNSVDSKDPDVATAWLDTLLDVIDLLPKDVIKKEILSIAIAKGQLSQSVQARLSCCRILGKIATKFEPFVIKKEILPVVQSLCQDVDYEVRGCMCRQLDKVARGLGLEATKSAILPELVELTNDEECYVRIAGLETVNEILSLLDAETSTTTIVPLVCKFCQQALQSEDATLPIVSMQYGKLCHGLAEHLTDEQKQWFIDHYKKLCKIGLAAERNKDSDQLPSLFELEDKLVECRRNAAFNFPAMVLFTGAKCFKSELHGTFSSLCKDPHISVRKTVSTGYHEVCKILGSHVQILQHDLITLLKDDSIEVLKGVISNIAVILDCYLSAGSNHTISDSKSNNVSEIIPAILGSEPVIFGSNNWRLQEELMNNLSCFIRVYNSENLHNKVIPLLFQKLKTARALPVKLAAARSALVIIRKLKKQEHREELLHRLVEDFCHAKSCYQRSVFIDICKIVIELYSKKFFKEHFFEYLLELHSDPVANIRLHLCSILPDLKQLIKLPTDRSLLQLLDMCVRKLLVAEKDRDVQYAIKTAVEELDKIHIQMESLTRRMYFEQDVADQKKEDEEKSLIEAEERELKKDEEKEDKKSKGDKRNSVSAKKVENGSGVSKIPAPKKGVKSGVASGTNTTISKDSTKNDGVTASQTKLKSKLPTTASASGKDRKPGNKSSSTDSTKPSDSSKPAGEKMCSPKLSRLPLYNSQPNLHEGRPESPSLIPVKASASSNKAGTSKGVSSRGGIPTPGSAGTRRGSNPSIVGGRRGSIPSASSSASEASTVKTSKSSNGAVLPSSKNRKKSK